ncbi:hypothetical protein CRG98_004536 [Punica granatum]|uniref:Retroviral polymerase SH3-like domain-containing protein n=1 Tax=Punica granatum TaxID=22663 RepID=A0A2I0L2Z3_PUNGR|nr:hypothetical protein CRG98_004536 [Punica granatum]
MEAGLSSFSTLATLVSDGENYQTMRMRAYLEGCDYWEAMKNAFEVAALPDNSTLNHIREFERLPMKEYETINEYSTKLIDIANKARILGTNLSDNRLVHKILVSLPESTPCDSWLVDSGFTNHMTSDEKLFRDLDKSMKVKRDKPREKAKPDVFVGYSLVSKAYIIYQPKTRKVITSRDVQFLEDEQWDWTDEPQGKQKELSLESDELVDDVPIRGTRSLTDIYQRTKFNLDGLVNKHKAKLVVKGYAQKKYLKEILKRFSMEERKSVNTPMGKKERLQKKDDAYSTDESLYRSLIGYLMYLIAIRPDIMFPAASVLWSQGQFPGLMMSGHHSTSKPTFVGNATYYGLKASFQPWNVSAGLTPLLWMTQTTISIPGIGSSGPPLFTHQHQKISGQSQKGLVFAFSDPASGLAVKAGTALAGCNLSWTLSDMRRNT